MLVLVFLVWGTVAASALAIGPDVTCPSSSVNVGSYASLNAAFDANGEGKTYNIPAGAYTLAYTIDLYQILDSVTCFVGAGSGQVTITITSDRHFRAYNSQYKRPSIGLKGVTLIGGAGGDFTANRGGVEAFRAKNIGMEDVVIERCQAQSYGGGLYVMTTSTLSTTVYVANSRFVNNNALSSASDAGSGGGFLLTSDATAPTYPVTLNQVRPF